MNSSIDFKKYFSMHFYMTNLMSLIPNSAHADCVTDYITIYKYAALRETIQKFAFNKKFLIYKLFLYYSFSILWTFFMIRFVIWIVYNIKTLIQYVLWNIAFCNLSKNWKLMNRDWYMPIQQNSFYDVDPDARMEI